MIGVVDDSRRTKRDLSKAREIFEQYDGSAFYMDHDGYLTTYESFAVPKSTESKWLAALTERYLARLDQPGNWKVVHFLCLHDDCRHIDLLSRQSARGVLWERLAFLERLLDYADQCRSKGCDRSAVRLLIDHVVTESLPLQRACRSARTKSRAKAVTDRANAAFDRAKP